MVAMKDGPVTEAHINSFGHIVYIFARLELVMQGVIARMAPADFGLVFLLTSGLTYSGKHDTFLSFLKSVQGYESEIRKIKEFVTKFDERNQLRNAIAHHNWKAGKRPGSIKPMHAVIRGGAGKFKGGDPNEPDYTADELTAIGYELGQLYNALVTYLDSVGLLPVPISRNTEVNSSETADSGGATSQ